MTGAPDQGARHVPNDANHHPLARQLAGGASHLRDGAPAPQASCLSWLILPAIGLLFYLGSVQPLLAIGLGVAAGAALLLGAFDRAASGDAIPS